MTDMRTKILPILLVVMLAATSAKAETIFGTILKVQGNVSTGTSVGGLAQVDVIEGARVGPGGLLVAGADGSAVMKLTPCSSLELGADASLSLDKLQLVRKAAGVTARAGEFTLSRGQVSFIMQGMQGRVSIPGGVLSISNAAVFSAAVSASGETTLTVFSGKVSVTNASGETFVVAAGEFASVSGASPSSAPQPAEGNSDAQSDLINLQQTIERADTLGLVCIDTLERIYGEFSALPPGVPPVEPRTPPVRRPPEGRPIVSPEQ
ncbi:FecR domain-containing protein [Phragmitibacter flavus]|nr:FecR domain-containing protein [Phragmitibacter flavus]